MSLRAWILGLVLAVPGLAQGVGEPVTGGLDEIGAPAFTLPAGGAAPTTGGMPILQAGGPVPGGLRFEPGSGPGDRPAGAAPVPPGTSSFASRLLTGKAKPAAAPAPVPELTPADPGDPVKVRLTVPARPAAPGPVEVVLTLVLTGHHHVYAPGETLGEPVTVVGAAAPGLAWGEAVFPPPVKKKVPLLGGELSLYEDAVTIRIPLTVSDPKAAGPVRLTVGYQACTDQVCLMARERVVGADFGASLVDPGAEPGGAAASTPAPAPAGTGGAFADALARDGVLWALLLAFAWGLAASISPCVYPMIPITVAYFGGQSEQKSRARTFALAATYVAGIAITYGLLGVAMARAGRDLGSLLVHPVVVTLVSGVLFAMGLSLYGVFELRLPQELHDRLSGGEAKGFTGAFFTGAVLGLVAAPCVGPFATSILLFVARSGDLGLGFLALSSFGLGMGSLFLVLALGVAGLPRSGIWLITTKKLFGYVLFGSALYFLQPVLPAAALLPAWGAYLAIAGVLGGALDPAEDSGERAARGFALLALVGGLYLFVAGLSAVAPLQGAGAGKAPSPGPAPTAAPAWIKDLEAARAAARSQGKPLFADFYADWCLPCKRMEAEVFPDPRVAAALARFVVAKIDCTRPEMPGARYKNEVLKTPAMPYLALFDAAGEPRPDLGHDGYLEVDEFLALLERASRTLGS